MNLLNWFRPTSHVSVGDLCVVINDHKFNGFECIVLSDLIKWRFDDGEKYWSHEIELQGHESITTHAKPRALKKLPPPGESSSWDECEFKPKELMTEVRIMASQYVKELRGLAANLRGEGWDMRANTVENAADRMERLEQLIVDAKDRFDDIVTADQEQS